jgi:hypothetical protein
VPRKTIASASRLDYANSRIQRAKQITIEAAPVESVTLSMGRVPLEQLYAQLRDRDYTDTVGQITVDCPVTFVLRGVSLAEFAKTIAGCLAGCLDE